MARSDVTVYVDVKDNGATLRSTKDLKGLTNAAREAGTSYKEGNKHQGDFFDKQNKGIIGTANSTRSFSKLAQTLGDGGGGLVGAYATLAANIFAVSAAFNALRSAAQVEQVLRGLELAGARVGRTYTTVANDLKELTNGALNSEQSLRAVAQISAAGFGADAMRDLTQAAFDTSVALGRNLTDSMERITRGVIKLEPELLDELGIMTKLTESNAAYAASLGKNVSQLTAFEKRQGYLNAVISEASVKFGGLSEAAGDAAAFDQLAATFTDLTKTVLNFVNNAALPLAALFSSSPAALGGLLLMFAGTLRNQLLPGLANLAKKSVEAAEAKKKLATEFSNEAKATLASAGANKEAAIAMQRGALQTTVGSKAYREYIAGVKSGNSVLEGREKALVSLGRSEAQYNAQIKRGVNVENATANLAAINAQKAAITELSNTETRAAQLQFDQQEKVRAARISAMVSIKESVAQNAAGNAVILAGQGSIRDSMNQYGGAVKKFSEAQTVAGNGAITMMGRLQTATFAATTGVRILGAAFLNFIPVIGQIILVVGLLTAAYEAMKSEATKAAEKARENFETVIKGTERAATELDRIANTSGPLALKTSQSITIQSNAVQELVAAYKEVIKTQKEVEENAATSGGASGTAGITSILGSITKSAATGGARSSITDMLFGGGDISRDVASYMTGIKRESEQFTPDIKEAFSFKNLILSDDAGIVTNRLAPAINALDALEPVLTDATKAALRFNEEKERISKIGNLTERAKQLETLIRRVEAATDGGATAIAALVDSLKEADLAFGEFTRGSIQSTSYDKVVDGLKEVNTAISNIEDSMARGVIGLDGWQDVLAGIGPEMAKYLSPASAELIKLTNEASVTKDALRELRESGETLTIGQEQDLTRAENTLRLNRYRLPIVVEEARQLQNQFVSMQNMERVTKSQIALEQARLGAASALYEASAAGVAARIDGENRIKQLQASMLQAQKAIIDASILQNRIELERLKIEESITGELEQQTIAIAQQFVEAANMFKADAEVKATAAGVTSENLARLAGLTGRLGESEAAMAAKALQRATQFAEQADERLTNLRTIESTTSNIAGLEAASASLANQIAAILVTIVTASERRAQMAQKTQEIEAENLSILQEQRGALRTANAAYAQQDRLLNNTADSLIGKIGVINTGLSQSLEDIRAGANARMNALRTQITVLEGSRDRDPEVADAGIAVLNRQIGLIELATAAREDEARATAGLQILELAIFDTRKEGLEWQRESLNLIQQQIDAQRELAEQVLRRTQAENVLRLRRMGLEQSEQGNEADEIRNATQAYVLAVRESSLKKSLIDLEFTLLEAQRELLREQLTERREALEQMNTGGRFNDRIDVLTASIDGLANSGALRDARRARMESVDENVRLLATTLQTVLQPTTTGFNNVLAELKGVQDAARARREAYEAMSSARTVEAPRATLPPRIEIAPNPQIEVNNTALAANTTAIEAVTEILRAAGIANAQTSLGSGVSQNQAVALAESQGFRVGELRGHGDGITGQHNGRGHREGRAMDINIGYGNTEANNPEMSRRMDALAAQYRAMGAKVLWKVAGHFDHMHVEFASAITNQVAMTATAQIASIARTEATAERAITTAPTTTIPITAAAANDNAEDNRDIVVTAAPRRPTIDLGVDTDAIRDMPMPDVTTKRTQDIEKIGIAMQNFNIITAQTRENLKALGPQGEAVAALAEGMTQIGSSVLAAMQMLDSPDANFADKFTAIASVAQAALSTIQTFMNASSNARIENIDKEIAAEQRRDGKSAESLAKIQSLEKKKDAAAKKQFNMNKKLMMAQAVIATATGITQALSYGPLGVPLAVLIGALGAAQLAVIAGTTYQSSAASATAAQGASKLSIGKSGDSVDLAKQNSNPGGELGYLRGNKGTGTNSSNYRVIGSAYGSDNMLRGYGSSAFVVGEKGPEIIRPESPISVTPVNDNNDGAKQVNATFHVSAIDSDGVEELLIKQKGNIISMIREAANSSGQRFLEDVRVETYSRPNVGRI